MMTKEYSITNFTSFLEERCNRISRDDCEIFIGDSLNKASPPIELESTYLISEFNSQGNSGGDCCGGRAVFYYSLHQPIEFGEVLLELTYGQIRNLPIKDFSYTDIGYYGNRDDYQVQAVNVDFIYRLYIENQIQIECE